MTATETGASESTTKIRGGWIVAYDGNEHRILKDGVVVYRGDTIVHVGKSYDGAIDSEIDASQHLVIPGLVNTHAHAGAMAGDRMILDEGRWDVFRSGFMNYIPTRGRDGPSMAAFSDFETNTRFSLSSMLRYGSTTVVELGGEGSDSPGRMVDIAAELGVRFYSSPGFGGAHHYFDADGRHHTEWDEKAGLEGIERAVRFIEENDGKHGGMFKGILVPYEFWTSTPAMLKRTKEAARQLGCGITTHLAETLMEFHQTVRETGKTPIRYLYDMGFLGPEVILGHCIYIGGHSTTGYALADDMKLLGESGASVAHSPSVFGRRGVAMESFQRYLDHGVNMSIGTDSYPQDIVAELKLVSMLSKVADRRFETAKTRDVFNAATLGGAKALRRDDLGRLAAGAKADIVIANFQRLRIGPFLDPIKAFVHCGDGDLVDTVIVNGKTVVDCGRVVAWDEAKLLADIRTSSDEAWRHFRAYHYRGAPIDEVYPTSFRPWKE